jgi:hypothetical protein
MTITRILIAAAAFTFLVSCNLSKNSESTKDADKFVYLDGYFSKNTLEFAENTKRVVLTNKNDFDHYFGIGKTMGNTVSKVDFGKNNYLAIITKPSSKKQTIAITKSEEKDGQLTVNYKLLEEGSQSFESNDVKIFGIPKTIKSVNFVLGNNSKLIEIRN